MKNTLAYPRSAALISALLLAVAFYRCTVDLLDWEFARCHGTVFLCPGRFPVWTGVGCQPSQFGFMLRERIGERAPRRMSLALLGAILAAGTMVLSPVSGLPTAITT